MTAKRMIAAFALASLPLATHASAPASADPRRDRDDYSEGRQRDHGKKFRPHARDDDDDRDFAPRGRGHWIEERRGRDVRRVYVYDRPNVVVVRRNVLAGPPPWAKGHGWRKKHDRPIRQVVVHDSRPRYVVNDLYLVPAGTGIGSCNRDAVGAALGGLLGAAAGASVTGGHDRAAGIIGGGVIGALVGAGLGRAMDQADQVCVGEALEHADNGERIVWATHGPHGAPNRYEVVPTETYQAGDGRYCREYQTTVVIGGRTERAYGAACRQPDGQWQKAS